MIVFLMALCPACSQHTTPQKLRPIVDSHVHIFPAETTMQQALRIFEQAGVERFCTKSAGACPSKRF